MKVGGLSGRKQQWWALNVMERENDQNSIHNVYEIVKEQKIDTFLTVAAGEVGGQEEEVGQGKEGEKEGEEEEEEEEEDREGEEDNAHKLWWPWLIGKR